MKRFIVFTFIMLLGAVFLIVPVSASINTDYKHIDDINSIAINYDFDSFTTYTNWTGGAHFAISFSDTSDIFGLPSIFESELQTGHISIYFTSNLPLSSFSDLSDTHKLIITNGSSYNYYEYMALNVMVYQVGYIYRLSADFESGMFQELDITSNSWSFSFKIFGDFSSGDEISVLSEYGEGNKSYFNFFYYKDLDTTIDDYWRGYGDGLNDGYNDGYGDGYDIGHNDGYDLGYDDGYDIGYDLAVEHQNNFNFTSLLAQVFVGLGTLLAIELLPGISIGAVIAVPIVFGIIAFIIGKRGGQGD